MCYMNCPYEKKFGTPETIREYKGSKYYYVPGAYCNITEEEKIKKDEEIE